MVHHRIILIPWNAYPNLDMHFAPHAQCHIALIAKPNQYQTHYNIVVKYRPYTHIPLRFVLVITAELCAKHDVITAYLPIIAKLLAALNSYVCPDQQPE